MGRRESSDVQDKTLDDYMKKYKYGDKKLEELSLVEKEKQTRKKKKAQQVGFTVPPYNKTLEMIPDARKPKFAGKGIMLNTKSFADDEFHKNSIRNSQRSS